MRCPVRQGPSILEFLLIQSYEVLSFIEAVNAVVTFGLVLGRWQTDVIKANRPAQLPAAPSCGERA